MLVDKKNANGNIKVCMLKRVGEIWINPATYKVDRRALSSVLAVAKL